MSDIRKWFMKQHDKGNEATPKPSKPPEKPSPPVPEKPAQGAQNSGRRKTSKYFAGVTEQGSKPNPKEETPSKRKTPHKATDDEIKPSPAKKVKVEDDDDFEPLVVEKKPSKKLKSGTGVGIAKKGAILDDDDDEDDELDEKDVKPLSKSSGRGRGGRGSGAATVAGRGRGGGGGTGVGIVKKGADLDDDDEDDELDEKDVKPLSKSSGRGRGGRGSGASTVAGRGRGGGGGTGVGIAKKGAILDDDDDEDDELDEKDVKPLSKSSGRGRGGRGSGASTVAGRGRGGGGGTGMGIVKKGAGLDDDDEDDELDEKDVKTPSKSSGRGRGGRGSGAATVAGRGRGSGGGRGGFMNFGERKDPPHKGEKEVPEGAPDCLAGLTFVISGTLDSLEREEAEDLIKRHGGRVTGSVSKKTNYLLADEDVGGRKSSKAKELGTAFLTEDGLFDMIRKSKPAKTSVQSDSKKKVLDKPGSLQTKNTLTKVEAKDDQVDSMSRKGTTKGVQSSISPSKRKGQTCVGRSLTWTEKYRPKDTNELIGNQSIVKQLHDWLAHWHEHFLDQKGKGKKQSDSGFKKAVLMSGPPGIGKTTAAKLISQMLRFETIEVNASDSRGKADANVIKGIGGSTSNSIKELISNEALSSGKDWSKHPKTVLIMDEVDGMSAGDRGGVADLIASIKISKIPIICICNDRYSQKLKSLVNYCLLLNFRKPTKQQMAKRLKQIADAEGLQVNEIALEELADRVNGDMRMALNQLQYMSLSCSAIQYDDIRQRLLNSAKDEDISPFTAVDKLFGFNGGKLRMDERIDLSMSDPDLVPLIIQENYINYRPLSIGKDENGIKRMDLLARAAESIADGDIVNVQIRRYRQWQLSQAGSFASCIIPAALMHGSRETLQPGERNFNRFGGWLGKNSTMGKNLRLLEDVHVHFLASQRSNVDRTTLRIDYFSLLLKQLTDPLRKMPKDDAVQKVVEFMDAYSLTQEDFDTIVELSKFQGHPNPMEGIQPAVKAALTKAYKQGSSSRVVRAADLITLPGLKKAPKKRIAAILEPVENGLPDENGVALEENEEENSSDIEDTDDGIKINGEVKPQLDLQSDKSKGIQVQLDLKTDGKPNAKKTPASKSRGSAAAAEKGSRSTGRGGKRKR